MMRPRHAALGALLVFVSLLALHVAPISHSDTAAPSSSTVTIHLRGNLGGWNGTNPTITVNAGVMVSVILSSDDIVHQFAVDLDNDTTSPTGMCPMGDACSRQFGLGPAFTFNFTAPMVPGGYSYFCTFHPEMLGRLIVVQPASAPQVTITGVSPNPADTG